MAEDKIYIGELAKIIHRRPNTIRQWEREKRLPEHLQSHRPSDEEGLLGWRYWTQGQVEQIKQWMIDEKLYPGSGLVNYTPDAKQIDESIDRLRVRP